MSLSRNTTRGVPGPQQEAKPRATACGRQAGPWGMGHVDTVPGDADAPWDESSAEALTRAWEAAASEWRLPPTPQAAAQGADRQGPAEDAEATALDARLTAFAATLDAWLQQIDPQKSQEGIQLRLQQFERRLEAALESLARIGDSSALLLIEAQVTELNTQFTAVRQELERLAGIDRQLAALSSLFGGEGRARATDLAIGREAAEDLGAADGPDAPSGVAPMAQGRDIIARLEGLLDRCIAERHRDEQRSATALQDIDAALAHIVERIDNLEAKGEGGAADDGPSDDDRLAQAYRAGARALGRDPFPFTLDAADYAAVGEERQPGRRATAAMAPHTAPAAEAAAAEGPRAKGALPAAMALLFAGGYLAVDGFLAPASPPSPVAAASASAGAAEPTASPGTDAPAALAVWQRVAGTGMRTTASEERTEARPALAEEGSLFTPASLPSAATWQGGTAASPTELPDEIGGNGLRAAAAAGDPGAQFEIASRFAEGRGVAVDNAQAFYWLQRAAMHGHGLAQYRLGTAFERGSGTASDPERAKAWYRRAAEQGVVRAMHNLAVLTIGQEPRPGDYATAARWFAAAANRGLVDSQFNLGLLCEDGLGVARDLTAAYQWYALAARAGDPEASRRLEQVKPQLSPEQLAAAESAVSAWRALAQP
jgi:hypothetical protein